MFKVASLSDVGIKRTHNEDAILVNTLASTFIVADGMGGHKKGEVASQLLIDTFTEVDTQVYTHSKNENYDEDDTLVPLSDIETHLNNIIKITTDKMMSYATENRIKTTMGTTVVGLKYLPNIQAWVLFHLGDSRAYHFRQNTLKQLTTDHSKYEVMKQQNMSQEAILQTGKNIITKAVGNFRAYKLDIDYLNTKPGDILLLCSDGISDLCSNEELNLLIIQYKDNLDFLCTQMKKLIYMRGAKDNLSIILIQV